MGGPHGLRNGPGCRAGHLLGHALLLHQRDRPHDASGPRHLRAARLRRLHRRAHRLGSACTPGRALHRHEGRASGDVGRIDRRGALDDGARRSPRARDVRRRLAPRRRGDVDDTLRSRLRHALAARGRSLPADGDGAHAAGRIRLHSLLADLPRVGGGLGMARRAGRLRGIAPFDLPSRAREPHSTIRAQ